MQRFDKADYFSLRDLSDNLEEDYWHSFAEDCSGCLAYEDSENAEIKETEIIAALNSPDSIDSGLEDEILYRTHSKLVKPYLNDLKCPEYIDQVVSKEFDSLQGKFKLEHRGRHRNIFAHVDRSDVLHLPRKRTMPETYEGEFKNAMLQVAVSVQNVQRMESYVSDKFKPLILCDNQNALPGVIAEKKELEDVPWHKEDQALDLAHRMQEKANSEEIITAWSTKPGVKSNEFMYRGNFNRDNIKYDVDKGEVVVADAGELTGDVNRRDVAQLLEPEFFDMVHTLTHPTTANTI